MTIQRFVSGCCEGERCRCGNAAEHKVEEVIFYDDPMPHRHPLTSYICHQHFVELMGPAAHALTQRPPASAVDRIEHIARDIAHELYSRGCTDTEHCARCEAAYQRICTTLKQYARGLQP